MGFRLVSQGQGLIADVRTIAKKLAKANSRLERARAEELMCRERVEVVHTGTSLGLTDNDIKKRTRQWSSASQEVRSCR